jgi:KaiC/GvpD/RAD55 family RecA-like ATPase
MSQRSHSTLKELFVAELFATSLKNLKILSICRNHLDFTYFENESEKKVWKFISNYFDLFDKCPSIGNMAQTLGNDEKVLELLANIKITKVHDDTSHLLPVLQLFIKRTRQNRMVEKWNEMNKRGESDDALEFLRDESERIANFKLGEEAHSWIFQDYLTRENMRLSRTPEEIYNSKVRTYIDELDEKLGGGVNRGRALCVLARSGGHKTSFLRHVAIKNALAGLKGVYIQGEDSKEESENMFDAAWMDISLDTLMKGEHLKGADRERLEETYNAIMEGGGDVALITNTEADGMYLEDIYVQLKDIEERIGQIDFICVDYLERMLFKSNRIGVNLKDERFRRVAISNYINNLAVRFKCAVFTATQANDIDPKEYNSEEYYLRRGQISESKGALNAFSFFITFNQTDDEAEGATMRILIEKARGRKRNQNLRIAMKPEHQIFYDRDTTMKRHYSPQLK